jgi:hypothetical protein
MSEGKIERLNRLGFVWCGQEAKRILQKTNDSTAGSSTCLSAWVSAMICLRVVPSQESGLKGRLYSDFSSPLSLPPSSPPSQPGQPPRVGVRTNSDGRHNVTRPLGWATTCLYETSYHLYEKEKRRATTEENRCWIGFCLSHCLVNKCTFSSRAWCVA